MTAIPPPGWTELDTALYRWLAAVAVPRRVEQMAALLTLLPFTPTEAFRVVELGCGEGRLAQVLLTCFPQATLLALDGSAQMRSLAANRLTPFAGRVQVEPFDLPARDWLPLINHADGVVSSLCLHHLSGPQKQALFADLHDRLSPRGGLLIADLVEPPRSEARELFAAGWDRLAREQAGNTNLFDLFVQAGWNHYRYPDPIDTPSPLFQQLTWLAQAGFTRVDCFWLQAGHAIYGGYKNPAGVGGISYETVLRAAQISAR
jgi:SAM-dependent methyltransferase